MENGSKKTAKVWKNGVELSHTDGTKDAEFLSIALMDGVVYTAGSESNGTVGVGKVWKNGQELYATDGTTDAACQAIAVVKE